jgi:hypothetical protein
MIKTHPLEWLDSLILQTFDPKNTTSSSISESTLSLTSENIAKESQKIQIQLKNEVFSLRKKRQIRLLIRKYHSTLIFLLDNVIENRKNTIFNAPNLSTSIDTIISALEELLSFIEIRFATYLSLDERVPITYLIVSRNELHLKLDKLQRKKWQNEIHQNIMESVISVLYQLIQSNRGYKITYRQILYQKEFFKSIDDFDESEKSVDIYTSLDELLIRLNFNAQVYITCLINRIVSNLDMQTTLTDRMSKLLFIFKEFRQLYSNESIMFEPSQQNIKSVLHNWFKHEVAYLEREIELNASSRTGVQTKNIDATVALDNKIECILSTDQMGLILRATDESRILKARSMSQIFKTIVPYLSTPFKKDLSYQSVRSKSYNAEERDKEIAIQTLEKIIKKIKSY